MPPRHLVPLTDRAAYPAPTRADASAGSELADGDRGGDVTGEPTDANQRPGPAQTGGRAAQSLDPPSGMPSVMLRLALERRHRNDWRAVPTQTAGCLDGARDTVIVIDAAGWHAFPAAVQFTGRSENVTPPGRFRWRLDLPIGARRRIPVVRSNDFTIR
jgi:hypothetical protein